ncbi:MAG: hypothetical protein ACHQRM_11645 [Bacteroidia bacterium]
MNVLATGIGLLAGICILSSCGNTSSVSDEKKDNSAVDSTAVKKGKKDASNAQKVFYALPSPIETADLLKKAGATYNKDYLNSLDNSTKYNTSAGRAMNLGVYGTDLSFTTIFDATSESMLYLKKVNSLASALGISEAFGEGTMDRMQANSNNRDSLLSIISDAYWTADAYLQENQRPSTSALIVAGGWVEGLYIATRVALSKNNPDINIRIAEQKLSLDNLIGLMTEQKKDQDVAGMLSDLIDLKDSFMKIKTSAGQASTSTDPNTKVTSVGGGSKFDVTKDDITEIAKKAETIRNKIINKS